MTQPPLKVVFTRRVKTGPSRAARRPCPSLPPARWPSFFVIFFLFFAFRLGTLTNVFNGLTAFCLPAFWNLATLANFFLAKMWQSPCRRRRFRPALDPAFKNPLSVVFQYVAGVAGAAFSRPV